MQGTNASFHGGMSISNPPSNSKLQDGDVLLEIKYTPNDVAYDPNYTGQEVSILIGQWGGYSPTSATWFINETNIDSVKLRILRNNSILPEIQLGASDWGLNSTLFYMTEANDIELDSTLNTSYPI